MYSDTGDVIQIENLTKIYRMGETTVEALRGVSFAVRRGEFVAIMGASGSGKSTLLNLLGCLDRPTGGSYLLDGRDTASCTEDELADIRGSKIGFVFQSFNLLSRTTARENIALPLSYSRGRGKDRDGEFADALLAAVGLPDRGKHRPNELSGGEQQRIALARALVNHPSVILADEPTGNLDTVRSREIMLMLASLNNAGITIILVTHEEDIAGYAKRLIRFRDGRIVSDEPVEQNTEALTARLDLSFLHHSAAAVPDDAGLAGSLSANGKTAPVETAAAGGRSTRSRWFTGREIIEHVHSAGVTLWHNRLRSLLTALGILIGVGAVIAMMSVGQGAQKDVQSRIEGLGSNLITVMPGSTRSGLSQGGAGTAPTLTLDDSNAIATEIDGIVGVAPEVGSRTQVQHGRYNWNTSITGTTADYPIVRNWQVDYGAFFTDADVRAHRSVCVIGQNIAANLYPGENPVGSTLRIRGASYRVVGVMTARGGSGFGNQDDVVLMPISTAMNRFTGQKLVRVVSVSVADKNLMGTVQKSITSLLRQRHRILPGAADDFAMVTQDDILKTVSGVSQTLTLLLASIAGISLLVGGIGIMNIMLVSVTERTREIGLRKAIGARKRDILLQFLTEAVILSGVGGLSGWVFGSIAARLVSTFGKMTTVVTPVMILLALGFSVAVGIFFGIFPARKAARLDPIQSLRYE